MTKNKNKNKNVIEDQIQKIQGLKNEFFQTKYQLEEELQKQTNVEVENIIEQWKEMIFSYKNIFKIDFKKIKSY